MVPIAIYIGLFLSSFHLCIALVVRYPDPKYLPDHGPKSIGRAVYQPYGPARVAASNAFTKWSRSQHSEDKTLFSRFFYGMMNGTVIESGAMNGVKYSNSYAFYKALNWKTLNIEGNPRIYERLNRDRLDSINVQAALCASPRKVHFIDAKRSAAVGGILEYMTPAFVREYYDMPNFNSVLHENNSFSYSGVEPGKCNITMVDCVPFSSVLNEVGIFQADLWVLDVEGAEFEVLAGTDFSRIRIGAIMLENQHKSSEKSLDLLYEVGYRMCHDVAKNLLCTHETFVSSMIH